MDRYERGRTGLGGSDISAVVGVNQWTSPLGVYLQVIGEAPPTPDNEKMRWGRKLEPMVLQEYAEREGEFVLGHGHDDDPTIFCPSGHAESAHVADVDDALQLLEEIRHPDHAWAMGHVDGLVLEKEGENNIGINPSVARLLEAKTTSAYASSSKWGEDGSDQIPTHYMAQVQWYAGILGTLTGREIPIDLAALFGDKTFRVYPIPFDPDSFSYLLSEGQRFWEEYVLTETAPPAGDSEADAHALKILHPSHEEGSEQVVEHGTDLHEKVRKLRDAREAKKEVKRRERELANAIKEHMGSTQKLVTDLGTISWTRTSDRRDTDYEEALENVREELHRWKEQRENGDGELIDTLLQLTYDAEEDATSIRFGSRRFYPRLKSADDES